MGVPAGNCNWTSIAIDKSGTPYLAYQDVLNGHKATGLRYDGTSWDTLGIAGCSAGWTWSVSLALDSSGYPYMAFGDVVNGDKTTVMKFAEVSTGIKNAPVAGASLSVFPNPCSGTCNLLIASGRNEDVTIVVTNIMGEKELDTKIQSNKETSLQLTVAPGIYFISAATTDSKLVSKILVE